MKTDIPSVLAELNTNISLEHGAIVQYLVTAYAMGEGEVGTEVINIARTEMRHLKMFGDLLVDLGGRPDMWRRGAIHLEAASAVQMMQNGTLAEDEAIAAYEAVLGRIDHPEAQRVIERVLADERLHREQFASFEAEVSELAARYPMAGPPAAAAAKVVALLNPAVQAEYAQILRNVREYLLSREFRHRDRMLEPMIWAMKHIGLIADEIHESGGAVNLVDLPVSEPFHDALAATASLLTSEQERLSLYARLADDLNDSGLRRLMDNFAVHQHYNVVEFEREIKRLKERAQAGAQRCPFHGTWSPDPRREWNPGDAPAGPSSTVGSLLGESPE